MLSVGQHNILGLRWVGWGVPFFGKSGGLASIVFSSSRMKGSPFRTFLPFSPLKGCQRAPKETSIAYCPTEGPLGG